MFEIEEQTCAGAVLRRLRERLLRGCKREDRGHETPCLIWRGTAGRYGTFSILNESTLPHRAAYELFVGPIPEGHDIDHLYRVSKCIEPTHLEAVLPIENTRRSDNPAGLNFRKTHCIRGHAFTTSNTIITGRGERQCRICVNARHRERRRRERV